MDKSFLQGQVGILLDQKQKLQWLVEHQVKANKVANFGCHIGSETLALAWAFNANEAIGIDKDEDTIRQAQDTLRYTQESIARISRSLQYYPNTEKKEERSWWENNVPNFLRGTIMQSGFLVSYVVGDITKPTRLESDHYDMAFCDFVLHHIWYDINRHNRKVDTKYAISEMMRVVRQGGVIAARELLQYDEKPRLDFRSLFEDVGLRMIHEKVTRVERGMFAEYLCEKPKLT